VSSALPRIRQSGERDGRIGGAEGRASDCPTTQIVGFETEVSGQVLDLTDRSLGRAAHLADPSAGAFEFQSSLQRKSDSE